MLAKGHQVDICTAKAYFYNLPFPNKVKKWLGYIDQYILFPITLKRKIKRGFSDTLFVFSDHALGPWVSLVKNLPHVIHCHDFLAQRSAKGQIPENSTSFTGRQYQKYIHRGYSQGKNFISVSKKTQNDLHEFLEEQPNSSEVVYNFLNPLIIQKEIIKSRTTFSQIVNTDLSAGYILHVGGNQWYKNRNGVLNIYNAWRNNSKLVLPLIMIGSPPNYELENLRQNSLFKKDIYFVQGVDDEMLNFAYSGSKVLLFPSLAEGFGWPIAEAMECGCVVVTTNEAPMTEVAGDSALLIPKLSFDQSIKEWSQVCAVVLERAIGMSSDERISMVKKGKLNAQRFKAEYILTEIETIYKKILLNN